jgi:FHA domain
MRVAPEDVQEYRFTVVRGAQPGARMTFEGGVRNLRIGRAVENDIVVSDPTVSRSHARVELRNDGWFLIDAGSSAGVEKMGFRIGASPEPLESGDEFKLGDTILKFEVVAKKGATKKAAAASIAPAGPSLLARIGLGSRRTQILALAVLVILALFLLWPSAPGLPPQATAPAGINYGSIVGWLPGVDESHLAKATFEVPIESEGVGLYFTVASQGGVEVRCGDRVVGSIPSGSAWQSYQLLFLPRAFSRGSKVNVEFRNAGYDPAKHDSDPSQAPTWAVKGMFLARAAGAPSSPAQLADDLRGTQGIAQRIDDNVGFRSAIIQSTRRAVLGVMKLSGRSAVLVPIPQAVPADRIANKIESARNDLTADHFEPALQDLTFTLGKADAEIAREYQRLVNNITLARKRESGEEEVVMLATMMRMLPDLTDPRRRAYLGDVEALAGERAELFNDTFDRLGEGVSG